MTHAQMPRPLRSDRQRAYALERSYGQPPAAACRAVGGKPENGQSTKWERNARVQQWISYYRSFGQPDERLVDLDRKYASGQFTNSPTRGNVVFCLGAGQSECPR
jgi:hypothetical protein